VHSQHNTPVVSVLAETEFVIALLVVALTVVAVFAVAVLVKAKLVKALPAGSRRESGDKVLEGSQ
jgi:cytochrome b